MNHSQNIITREARHKELQQLWQQKESRMQMLSLFHRLLPDDQKPQAGMSVIDAILEHEFGK
ncbi:hypothetical protein Pan153_52030 [Gimesia panareensis]|uniref:Uncharacterized protein n=1 Tax=Gimesia panareensis TaxID=2527978 RepID=A0A518FW05_9PLAN|nr:hypothetical protein [Gimesia panareensis]QDV20528.1 hypothetical protein Pan153_52030 [Gimesia panareensis]